MVPYNQATVHFLTPTLHYGVGVFEGICCYQASNGPAVFRLRDHIVILDPQGYVAECTGENFYMQRRGTLLTPPIANVLEGLTRDLVLTLAQDMSICLVGLCALIQICTSV